MAVVACLIRCILRCIEELVKVLNHNAVIVMALTGESYCDAAKSTISIIFDNFGLFIIVDWINDFVEFYGIIICVLIPAVLGGVISYYNSPASVATTVAVFVGIAILLLAIIVSDVILGVLTETLSSIFIFYSFDRKFRA